MASDALERQLVEALGKVAATHGIDIVDVEVVGATKAPTVRVRVDHADESPTPIGLDEVAAQNPWISDVIDIIDPFPGSYTLEVSSPGLARPLRRPRDFERFSGEEVSLTTTATEGRRHFVGTLVGLEGDAVRLACDDGTHDFPLDEVKRCTIRPRIDFSGSAGKSE